MTTVSPNLALYLSIAIYAVAAGLVFLSLLTRRESLQRFSTAAVMGGFVTHTIWIGTICSTTHHPPLTNLPEAASFLAWLLVVVELALLFRYKVQAAAFFVYPLVVILLATAAIVSEPFSPPTPDQTSKIFIGHLLLTLVGIAALLIGLAFGALYQMQDRAMKAKKRGALYDWIPNLRVLDLVSYRSMVFGFAIYSAGILAGVLYAYNRHGALTSFSAKEVGALVAWVAFAAILQSHLSGTFRTRKTAGVALVAFLAIVVSIFGIDRG
ncbi:MAG: cytochrome C assembly family protein [Thermoanaerobaculia bacterium]